MSESAKFFTGKSLAFKLTIVLFVKLVFLAALWQFLVRPHLKHIGSVQVEEHIVQTTK